MIHQQPPRIPVGHGVAEVRLRRASRDELTCISARSNKLVFTSSLPWARLCSIRFNQTHPEEDERSGSTNTAHGSDLRLPPASGALLRSPNCSVLGQGHRGQRSLLGLLSRPVIGISLHTPQTTGCDLPPCPAGRSGRRRGGATTCWRPASCGGRSTSRPRVGAAGGALRAARRRPRHRRRLWLAVLCLSFPSLLFAKPSSHRYFICSSRSQII